MRNLTRFGYLAAGIVLGAMGVSALHAQEETKRIELRRADLTGAAGTEVIMARLEIPPGGLVPRHFHHGDEFLYVLDGGSFRAPGRDPVTLGAGATLHFPREVPHGGFKVVGEGPLKVLTVHVVDKGKPLVEVVK